MINTQKTIHSYENSIYNTQIQVNSEDLAKFLRTHLLNTMGKHYNWVSHMSWVSNSSFFSSSDLIYTYKPMKVCKFVEKGNIPDSRVCKVKCWAKFRIQQLPKINFTIQYIFFMVKLQIELVQLFQIFLSSKTIHGVSEDSWYFKRMIQYT